MRRIFLATELLVAVLLCPGGLLAQDSSKPSADGKANGLTPLSPPYVISTAPHFAIWVQFPREDSIRRIALGDSSYFLAEADKDDPHYAIVKQIKAVNGRRGRPVESNMLVYMASGKVINITLRSGGTEQIAYLIDYPVPELEPKQALPLEPELSPAEMERGKREHARRLLVAKMMEELKSSPRQGNAIVSGGLALRLHRIQRRDELALVSFDVENLTSDVVDLVGPHLSLVTVADKKKRGKKDIALNNEPIPLLDSAMSQSQLSPGEKAFGVVQFIPPVHDANQQVVLSVANRAMADRTAQVQIE